MKKRKIKVKALSHSYNNKLAEMINAWIIDNNVEIVKMHFLISSIMHNVYIEYYEVEE